MMVWSQWQCTKWTSGRAFFGMMVWLQWQCIKWPQLKNFSSSFFWNWINLGKNSHSSEKQLQQNFDHIRVWLITTKNKKFEPDNFIDLATYYKTKPKKSLTATRTSIIFRCPYSAAWWSAVLLTWCIPTRSFTLPVLLDKYCTTPS